MPKTNALLKRSPSKSGGKAAADSHQSAAEPAALYQQVKDYVNHRINSGEWKSGDRISSEAELVEGLGVSRMTVNRALRELTAQGKLTRIVGVGSFVAEPKRQTTLSFITNIGEEIRARGHDYKCDVVQLAREAAPVDIAASFGLRTGASVFHIVCVHRENGVAVRLEDRFVNPACAPDFIKQKFDHSDPSEYLLKTIPANEFEHVVDAVLPTRTEAKLLDIDLAQPCLVLTRRSWSNGVPVTFVRFSHPGTRYRLGSRFKSESER